MSAQNITLAAKVLRPVVASALFFLCCALAVQAQGDLSGFPKYHTNNQLGAPLFFDLDGDGIDELLHANGDHTTDIWTAGGAAFPGWPAPAGWHTWNMTPSVGDLDGDGSLEVVTATSNNMVHAYHADGTNVAGFPRNLGAEIGGACCLADLDGDGDMEIIVQPRTTRVYAIQGDGSDLAGWPVTIPLSEGGAQTAAAADLDGDGSLEVITTSQGIPSTLSVFRADGTNFPGFPVTVTYTVGSPVVADLDRDGDLEIIYTVGSDLAARHHDGSMVAGFKVDCGTWTLYTSVAVGDIDRDGYPEIVFGSQNDNVYVVRHDGSFQPGWPSPPTTGTVHATPALADLDGDGDLEIIVAAPTSGTGMIYAWHHDQSDVAGFPWSRPSTFYGGVTLGDIDGDNKLDFAASGRSGSALYAWSTTFSYDARRIVHGSYRVNRHNNALHNFHPRDGQAGLSLTVPPATTTGSTVTIGIEGGNSSQSGATLFGLLQVETPGGARVNLIGPVPATLLPGGSFSFPYNISIPAAAPSGGYRVIALLANASARIVQYDCELLTVY
jgi:hypothetical protein